MAKPALFILRAASDCFFIILSDETMTIRFPIDQSLRVPLTA